MNGSRVRHSVWISTMAAAILVASYPHSVLWAQDGVGSGGTPSLSFAPIPIDDDLTIIIPIERNIPPDPGVAGDATLAGIDSDKDGVRDDVEREIVRLYQNNAKARAVLYQEAKYYQALIINSLSASVVLDSFSNLAALTPCLVAATGDAAAGSDMLRPQLLNTYDRGLAYITAMKTIDGVVALPSKTVTCP